MSAHRGLDRVARLGQGRRVLRAVLRVGLVLALATTAGCGAHAAPAHHAAAAPPPPPPPTPHPKAPAPKPVRPPVPPGSIRDVVTAHRRGVMHCYETARAKKPALAGSVAITWNFDARGAVTDASVAASTLHDSGAEECMLREVRTWRFPAGDGASQVTYPFSFSAR